MTVLYRNRSAVIPILFVIAIVILTWGYGYTGWGVLSPAVAAVLSVVYFRRKEAAQHKKLQSALGLHYSRIFDEMNKTLFRLRDSGLPSSELSATERETLQSYFALCGEEYLLFHKGFIDERIWLGWYLRMREYYHVPAIQELWNVGLNTGSYSGMTALTILGGDPRAYRSDY